MTKLSVLIPTYRRPRLFLRLYEALLRQTRPADEIVAVVRSGDKETEEIIKSIVNRNAEGSLIVVAVDKPGIVHAENAALKRASGDIVCLIDDDAIPQRDDWLEIIEQHFQDLSVGAVGGPVINRKDGKCSPAKSGKASDWCIFTSFGFHKVDFAIVPKTIIKTRLLLECNMSLRKNLFKEFDTNLLGYDEKFGDDILLTIHNKGYKILCNPQLIVFHDPQRLPASDMRTLQRTAFNLNHNQTYVWLKNLNVPGKFAFALLNFLMGDYSSKGILMYILWLGKYIYRPRKILGITLEIPPAFAGKTWGMMTYLKRCLSNKKLSPTDATLSGQYGRI